MVMGTLQPRWLKGVGSLLALLLLESYKPRI